MPALPTLPALLILLETERAVRTSIAAPRTFRRYPVVVPPAVFAVPANRHRRESLPNEPQPNKAVAVASFFVICRPCYHSGSYFLWTERHLGLPASHTPQSGRSAARTAAAPVTRKGTRRKKIEIVQLWRCASCSTRSRSTTSAILSTRPNIVLNHSTVLRTRSPNDAPPFFFAALSPHQHSSKARVRYQCSSALPSGWPSRSHRA
jgi:hypothetical protein